MVAPSALTRTFIREGSNNLLIRPLIEDLTPPLSLFSRDLIDHPSLSAKSRYSSAVAMASGRQWCLKGNEDV